MSPFLPDSPLVGQILPSPNYGARKAEAQVNILVLHYTGMPTKAAALKRLCEPSSEVSCHYCIDSQGHILQLVPEEKRAWHAGHSYWAGERDINSYSIGIELVHPGHLLLPLTPYLDAQIEALLLLCQDILTRHSIPRHLVLAHSDVAPERKQDPGELFPWKRLYAAKIAHYVPPSPLLSKEEIICARGDKGPQVAHIQRLLGEYGYGPFPQEGAFDLSTEHIVRAFQRHFRPARIDGRVDFSTRHTLECLLDERACAHEKHS